LNNVPSSVVCCKAYIVCTVLMQDIQQADIKMLFSVTFEVN